MQHLHRSRRTEIEQSWTEQSWTTKVAALSAELGVDRRRAERLLHRVIHNYRNPVELDRYGVSEPLIGVGGVMHYGMDSEVEDSSWTIGYFWRADGLPIWCDPLLIANDRGITSIESGQEFADRLMLLLGISSDFMSSDLTVTVRNGTLYVFLPPIVCELLFLKVVHAIELIAVFMMMPVRLEGFGPPVGDIICGFEIMSGLDVSEINIHPVQPWPQLLVFNSILERSATAMGLTMQFSWDGQCLEPIEEVVQTSFPSSVFLRSATETRSLQSAVTA